MKYFNLFMYHFFHVLWKVRMVIIGLLLLIILGAWIISHVEGISFGDSLYFSLVTGLTVGYGDIVAKTVIGRVTALIIGWIGIIYTGLNVAAAVRAVKEVYEIDIDIEEGSTKEGK